MLLAGALAATVILPAPPRAGAAPIADLEQQAEDLAARIEANTERAAGLNEQVKFAESRLDEANAAAADARARIEAEGIEYRGPDLGVERSIYVRDPDGVQIELVAVPLLDTNFT